MEIGSWKMEVGMVPIGHGTYRKRFIAASNRCTTKSLLTICLAKITCHFREYCNGI